MKNSSKHKVSGWPALAAVALGVILCGIGLWTLGWRPQTQSTSAAVNGPTATRNGPIATRIVAVLPTATRQPTATPTRPPPAATATVTAPAANEPLELAIVHSNDTWGYTRPCG